MMSLRNAAARLAYGLVATSGIPRRRRRNGAVVFCFHNVVRDNIAGHAGDRSLHIGVGDFERYIDWIGGAHTVVPVDELVGRLRARQSVDGLAVLTFDDGYAGTIRHAVPVMRSAGLPFALFPVVDAAEKRRPFWWDSVGPLSNDERERFLTTLRGDAGAIEAGRVDADLPEELFPASWAQLRAVLGDDCTIGAHTVTHRNLSTLSPDELAAELRDARTELERSMGVVADVVAYPYGRDSAAVHRAAQEAGYSGGLTLDFGLNTTETPPFAIRRVSVPQGIRRSTLACWAAGIRLG